MRPVAIVEVNAARGADAAFEAAARSRGALRSLVVRPLRGLFDIFGGGDEEQIEGGATGGVAGTAASELIKGSTPEGGSPIVREVQAAILQRGGKLPKYGADGKWGTESQDAWNAVVGGPITRAKVAELVGHDYAGSMAVFGITEGGGVQPQPEPQPEPKDDNGLQLADPAGSPASKYLVPGLVIVGAGAAAFALARYFKNRRRSL